MKNAYDIIGDVHGHADKLVRLLEKLGYRRWGGVWRHPERMAVFVGDLIDRGPNQVVTVGIVRSMVEAGHAHCVMGNHEFNAIAWATPDPDAAGAFLRRHDRPGNGHQHEKFLKEVEGTPKHDEIIRWFRTLPLWLDLGAIRVVHACWNSRAMATLRPRLDDRNCMSDDLLVASSREGTPEFDAVEILLKGIEMELPEGVAFFDSDGKERRAARIKWWLSDLSSLKASALAPPDVTMAMPDIPLPNDPRLVPYEGPPLFFGHYWFSGTPSVLGACLACVDYSAGKDGPLVAYRWEGEAQLENFRLIYV